MTLVRQVVSKNMHFLHLKYKNSNACFFSHSNVEEIDNTCMTVLSNLSAIMLNVRHYKLGTGTGFTLSDPKGKNSIQQLEHGQWSGGLRTSIPHLRAS